MGNYEKTLLGETRDEITRADSKASILFSLFGLLSGAVVYALLRDQWQPFELANGIEWLWWLGAGLGLAAIVTLGLAVYPVVDHPGDKRQVAYFGHVAQFKHRTEYLEAIANREGSEVERLRDQIWVLSKAVDGKYRHTRWAMRLFAAGVTSMLLAVGIDQFLL